MLDGGTVWEMALRGAVGALLAFHLAHLAAAPARATARIALALFTLSVLAYLVCSMPASVPRIGWLDVPAFVLCVNSVAFMWLAARAVFDDHFGFSLKVAALLFAAVLLGLLAHGVEPVGAAASQQRAGLRAAHAAAMLGFGMAALWEVARGWRADLVESRRLARRWVALAIGLYALLVLAVEWVLRDATIGRLLPVLHAATIGAITLALAVAVTRRPLAQLLGADAAGPSGASGEVEPEVVAPLPMPATGREANLLAALNRAMDGDNAYRREGLTLAALAETLRATEPALRALINQRLGYRNFNDFLHHYRLQEASTRLLAEDLPILSIALECGYGSIGPFNRAFKQRFGLTPTEHRAADRVAKARRTN